MTALAFPASREIHDGSEAICRHGEVTPRREEDSGSIAVAAARRATDVTKLTFPLQMVIVIIGGIVATTGAFWISTSSLRSDVRDILTRMMMQADIDKTYRAQEEERFNDFRHALDKEERERKLLEYDFKTKLKELEDAIRGHK